jgi:WD40 repeat protein
VKRSGSLISDFGLYFGDVIGHLTAIKPAVAREMLSRILWGVQTRQILLLAVSFWASPPLSGAVSQDAAPPTPPVEFTVQTGHTADIQGLEYAANGKFFVSGGKDSTIKVWSPEGTLIRTIRTGFWVNYLALSHDGQLLLAATRTGNIFLLSLDGRVVHRFPDIPMREGFVSAVALSDDNRHAAIGTTRAMRASVAFGGETRSAELGPSLRSLTRGPGIAPASISTGSQSFCGYLEISKSSAVPRLTGKICREKS